MGGGGGGCWLRRVATCEDGCARDNSVSVLVRACVRVACVQISRMVDATFARAADRHALRLSTQLPGSAAAAARPSSATAAAAAAAESDDGDGDSTDVGVDEDEEMGSGDDAALAAHVARAAERRSGMRAAAAAARSAAAAGKAL